MTLQVCWCLLCDVYQDESCSYEERSFLVGIPAVCELAPVVFVRSGYPSGKLGIDSCQKLAGMTRERERILGVWVPLANEPFPYLFPQHFLYFLPLPQGHDSLRPTLRPWVMSWNRLLSARRDSQSTQVHSKG